MERKAPRSRASKVSSTEAHQVEEQAISQVRGASRKGRLPGGTDQASGSRGLAPHFPAPTS